MSVCVPVIFSVRCEKCQNSECLILYLMSYGNYMYIRNNCIPLCIYIFRMCKEYWSFVLDYYSYIYCKIGNEIHFTFYFRWLNGCKICISLTNPLVTVVFL